MWKSVALVAGLGGMFGAILAVAGRKLAVHTDPAVIPAAADWLKPSLPDATVFHPVWPVRLILKRK